MRSDAILKTKSFGFFSRQLCFRMHIALNTLGWFMGLGAQEPCCGRYADCRHN